MEDSCRPCKRPPPRVDSHGWPSLVRFALVCLPYRVDVTEKISLNAMKRFPIRNLGSDNIDGSGQQALPSDLSVLSYLTSL